MKYLILSNLILLSSCNTLPQLYQGLDDVATHEAIEVYVSKVAVQKDANVTISIEVIKPIPPQK